MTYISNKLSMYKYMDNSLHSKFPEIITTGLVAASLTSFFNYIIKLKSDPNLELDKKIDKLNNLLILDRNMNNSLMKIIDKINQSRNQPSAQKILTNKSLNAQSDDSINNPNRNLTIEQNFYFDGQNNSQLGNLSVDSISNVMTNFSKIPGSSLILNAIPGASFLKYIPSGNTTKNLVLFSGLIYLISKTISSFRSMGTIKDIDEKKDKIIVPVDTRSVDDILKQL